MMFSTAASSIEKKALPFVASDRKHEFWEEFFWAMCIRKVDRSAGQECVFQAPGGGTAVFPKGFAALTSCRS